MYQITDLLQDSRLAAKWAAELDVAACEYRAQAARSRSHAITCELAGDAEGVIKWTARAEDAEEAARDIAAQRNQIIARFCPVTIDVEIESDCGVCA